MKKKCLAFLLVFLLLISLCSCELSDAATWFESFNADLPSPENSQAKPEQENTILALNMYSATMESGSTLVLTVLTGANDTLRWSSSNENVALVNSQGLVTAVGPGAANITCSAENAVSAVCTIIVKESTQPVSPTAYDYIFPHSSTSYLTRSEVVSKLAAMQGISPSGNYALDAINEIYARNGYIFSSPELRAYYEEKPWYTPNANFSAGNFNAYESANIALLMDCA